LSDGKRFSSAHLVFNASVQNEKVLGYPTLFVPVTAFATNQHCPILIRVRNEKTGWVDVKMGATTAGKTGVSGDI